MWDYVYYSLYLDNIDTGDHTAIQKYVYKMVRMICRVLTFHCLSITFPLMNDTK